MRREEGAVEGVRDVAGEVEDMRARTLPRPAREPQGAGDPRKRTWSGAFVASKNRPMATIRFRGYGETEVRVGTTILEAAKQAKAPEGSDCGGCCSCSTCHVYVHAGAELLSSRDDDELDILEIAEDVRKTSRLGCQAKVKRDGVVEVDISKESFETYLAEHPHERAKLSPPKV